MMGIKLFHRLFRCPTKIGRYIFLIVALGFNPTIAFSQKPLPPTLSDPQDDLTVNTSTPIFDWYELENTDSYALAIYSDEECSEKVLKEIVKGPPYQISDGYLEQGKRYFWRVSGQRKGIWGAPSEIWTFTVAEKISEEKISLPVVEKDIEAKEKATVVKVVKSSIISFWGSIKQKLTKVGEVLYYYIGEILLKNKEVVINVVIVISVICFIITVIIISLRRIKKRAAIKTTIQKEQLSIVKVKLPDAKTIVKKIISTQKTKYQLRTAFVSIFCLLIIFGISWYIFTENLRLKAQNAINLAKNNLDSAYSICSGSDRALLNDAEKLISKSEEMLKKGILTYHPYQRVKFLIDAKKLVITTSENINAIVKLVSEKKDAEKARDEASEIITEAKSQMIDVTPAEEKLKNGLIDYDNKNYVVARNIFYEAKKIAEEISISIITKRKIAEAEKELTKAKNYEAAKYTKNIFEQAKGSLTKAKTFFDDKKFVEAKSTAEESIKQSQEAYNETRKIKEAKKMAKEAIDSAKNDISSALRARGVKESDLTDAKSCLSSAVSAFSRGNWKEANEHASRVRQYTDQARRTGMERICKICNGSGKDTRCFGSGKVICSYCNGTKGERVTCSGCGGDGRVTCGKCSGSGVVKCDACLANIAAQVLSAAILKEKSSGTYQPCRKCGDSGKIGCSECNGSGQGTCSRCNGSGQIWKDCENCSGTGKLNCDDCQGTGKCQNCGGDGIVD